MFQKIRKVFTDHPYRVMTIVILVGLLLYSFRSPIENHSPLGTPKESLNIPLTTSVKTAPRTSTSDANVEVEQHYTAKVNGQTVTIPIKESSKSTPNGVKGIIQQEVDMTPIVDKAVKDGVAKAKKNWELGAGAGVHQGDLYIPIELQRNYKVDRAVSLEIHVEPSANLKVTGGEIKYKVLF